MNRARGRETVTPADMGIDKVQTEVRIRHC